MDYSDCSEHPATRQPEKIRLFKQQEENCLYRSLNGNGNNYISVAHWNLGATHWKRNINIIQLLVDKINHDYLFISEANLYNETPQYESNSCSYNIIKPRTSLVHNHSRLVLLAKEDQTYKVLTDLMNSQVASIWLNVSTPGARRTLLCGMYREHQFKHQPTLNPSAQLPAQYKRWESFMVQVGRASRMSSSCTIIGDLNLDFET